MLTVAGYELDPGRRYDPEANLWVVERPGGRARVGFDPLGAETAGDIVAISFAEAGTRLGRGERLATIEAAKFVGPLACPIGGTLAAVNGDVLAAPGTINRDPLGAWLVELDDADPADLDRLVSGPDAIRSWFADAVERFRRAGALAE